LHPELRNPAKRDEAVLALTAHQRDRAQFVTACLARGKLEYADPQIWREMRAFASKHPRDPIVRRLAKVLANGIGNFARQGRARSPRRRSVRSSRAKARAPGSRSSDDDPHDLDVAPLSRFRRDVRRWQKDAMA
jgi:hypothetical protein